MIQQYLASKHLLTYTEKKDIMKLAMFKTMLFFFFNASVLSILATAASLKLEVEGEYSYDEHSITGPEFWGQLCPGWFLCSNGTKQSPINLKTASYPTRFGGLKAVYKPAFSTLINRGHDIALSWEASPGYIKINGIRYNLKQCHWHTPSEHTVEGQRYDLEIHCVHQTTTNMTAVIATLYKIGAVPDPFLTSLTAPLITLANGALDAPVGVVNPIQIKMASSQYYRYIGSLTTPPCTEDIVWTVFREVKSVTRAQVSLLQEAVHDVHGNARPLQPLNKRTVLLYDLKAKIALNSISQYLQADQ